MILRLGPVRTARTDLEAPVMAEAQKLRFLDEPATLLPLASDDDRPVAFGQVDARGFRCRRRGSSFERLSADVFDRPLGSRSEEGCDEGIMVGWSLSTPIVSIVYDRRISITPTGAQAARLQEADGGSDQAVRWRGTPVIRSCGRTSRWLLCGHTDPGIATRPRALPRLRSVSGCVLMNFRGGPHGSAGRARR